MAIDVRREAEQEHRPVQPHELRDVHQTTGCIVGGGPGGMILGLLLARQGIPTTLLEAHADFDREFRGDSIHPAIMDILPRGRTRTTPARFGATYKNPAD